MSLQYNKLINLGYKPIRRKDYAEVSPVKGLPSSVDTNLFDLGNAFLRPDVLNMIRARKIMPVLTPLEQLDLAKVVNDRLKILAVDAKLILSAEAFSFYRTAAEKTLIDILFSDLDLNVLLIERNIVDWISSYMVQTKWLQKNEQHLLKQPGSVFDFSDTGWMLNTKDLKTVFGIQESQQYEDMIHLDGSVIPSFVRWLGLQQSNFEDGLDTWHNVTPKF